MPKVNILKLNEDNELKGAIFVCVGLRKNAMVKNKEYRRSLRRNKPNSKGTDKKIRISNNVHIHKKIEERSKRNIEMKENRHLTEYGDRNFRGQSVDKNVQCVDALTLIDF